VNPPRILLDENLSPTIAILLCNQGIDATHVRDRGLNGAPDSEVFELAFVEDRVVVTLNVSDFVKLARARAVHAGLVLIEQGGLKRDEQFRIVLRALAVIHSELGEGRDMVNRALHLTADAHRFEALP
jgi:predicted nuclease of predicted toxin-antitoxin system